MYPQTSKILCNENAGSEHERLKLLFPNSHANKFIIQSINVLKTGGNHFGSKHTFHLQKTKQCGILDPMPHFLQIKIPEPCSSESLSFICNPPPCTSLPPIQLSLKFNSRKYSWQKPLDFSLIIRFCFVTICIDVHTICFTTWYLFGISYVSQGVVTHCRS